MRKCVALAMALLLLSGCSSVSREPDDLALVRVLGVDGAGQVTLTAVCGKEPQSGVLRGSAKGDSFEQARQAVIWSGEGKELSLTGVSHLLIGPDVELDRVLFAILEDADLGASATVWVAEEGAETLLKNSADPSAELELLALQNADVPSVAQALAALTSCGETRLPCVEVKEGVVEKKGDMTWSADH